MEKKCDAPSVGGERALPSQATHHVVAAALVLGHADPEGHKVHAVLAVPVEYVPAALQRVVVWVMAESGGGGGCKKAKRVMTAGGIAAASSRACVLQLL
jgi:hypothetical protein